MIVVDTNIIAFLVIPGERTTQAEQALTKDPLWFAPLLWRSELCNALALYVRKNILALNTAQEAYQHAAILMETREIPVPHSRVLELASSSGLSAYDCEFLVVAQEMNSQLLTEDSGILKQFPDVATSLRDFLE
jgi:predicted nucleic acid-binding protein